MAISAEQRNFNFPGTSVDFPYRVFKTEEGSDESTPVLYLHGYGEGDVSTKLIAEEAQASGISLIMPKVDFANLRDRGGLGTRRNAIDRISKEFLPHLLEELSNEYDTTLNTAAYSMGAMILAHGIDETAGEYTGSVAVVNGMGTTTDPEKGRLHRTRAAYLARFGVAALLGTKPQRGYIAAGNNIAKTIARDSVISRTLGAQLEIANETPTMRTLVDHAARGNNVNIFAGERDYLFNPNKAHATFEQATVGLHIPTLQFGIIPELTHQNGGMDKARAAIVFAAKLIK